MTETAIRPLYDDVRVLQGSGRYSIQLEIPPESTLSERDLSRIVELATWDKDPNQHADGFEGGRGILLRRENAIERGGLKFEGVQISGTAYRTIEAGDNVVIISTKEQFVPPSKANFIEGLQQGLMTTSYAERGQIRDQRPKYRARGTYTATELEQKVRNTRRISTLSFQKFVTPQVEAYGRYLDDDLRNDEGRFGFLVYPVLDISGARLASKVVTYLRDLAQDGKKPEEVYDEFMSYSRVIVKMTTRAIHELHQQEIAHRQPHLSNVDFPEGGYKPYLLDWATLTHLGKSPIDRAINRTIDAKKVIDNLTLGIPKTIFRNVSSTLTNKMSTELLALMISTYSGQEWSPTELARLGVRVESQLRKPASDFDVIKYWMMQYEAGRLDSLRS